MSPMKMRLRLRDRISSQCLTYPAGLNPVSQTQPSTSATGRPTQEKCVTSSREESTRRTPPKDRLGKRSPSAGQASPHSSKREQRRRSRRSRDRCFQRQHHGQTDPRAAWATYEGRATKKEGGARGRFLVPKQTKRRDSDSDSN